MGAHKQPRYIALSEVNMDFTPRELEVFDTLMAEGHDIRDVARYMKRNSLEVFLLYLDRVYYDLLEPVYALRRIGGK